MLMKSSAAPLAAFLTASLLSVALPVVSTLAQDSAATAASTQSEPRLNHRITIPTITTVGSNVEDAVLLDILAGNVVDNAEALAGLNAGSVTVPEISVVLTGKQADGRKYSSTITLTDLVLSDIVDGVAGSVSLASTDMTTRNDSFSFGMLSAANLNIAALLGIYGLVETTGTDLQTIYTDFSAEGGTLKSNEFGCDIGPVSGADFKARPFRTSFMDLMGMVEAMEENPDDMDPAFIGTMMGMYADILTAFETSEVSFGGMTCEGVDDDGRNIAFALGSGTMGGMSPGMYPAITIEGYEMSLDEGTISLDQMVVKPADLSAIVATLQSAPEIVDDAWFEANSRGLIPAFEGFSFSGYNMDIDDPDSGERIQASVGAFDLTLGSYLNGIPTIASMTGENIQLTLPEDSGDEAIDQLRALGLEDIDAGFRIAASWDEASSVIDIEEVSFNGADLAAVTLSGTIANATANLFDLDVDTALAAGIAVAIKTLDLEVVDEGLSDILLGVMSAEQGVPAASLRPVYADLAKGSIIGFMADLADSAKLGDAVSAFIAGQAKTLQIGVEAKSKSGIGFVDFMEAETNPASLLGKINVSAEAK